MKLILMSFRLAPQVQGLLKKTMKKKKNKESNVTLGKCAYFFCK